MIIDAKNSILGRVSSFAAKKALEGETVDIINCEYAIITGDKKTTLKHYDIRLKRGSKNTGPFMYRKPNMFFKRTIRGMLPYKKESGKKAMKRIKCYMGIPAEFKDKKIEKLEKMDISKLPVMKYTTVKDICNSMGWKS